MVVDVIVVMKEYLGENSVGGEIHLQIQMHEVLHLHFLDIIHLLIQMINDQISVIHLIIELIELNFEHV